MTKLKDGPGEENNPIERYREWTEHRYDQGHWLGGNVDPITRSMWSVAPTQRRLIGGVIVAFALFGVYEAWTVEGKDLPQFVYMMLGLGILSFPGFVMLFARRKPPPAFRSQKEKRFVTRVARIRRICRGQPRRAA